jgi:hypothetical protein
MVASGCNPKTVPARSRYDHLGFRRYSGSPGCSISQVSGLVSSIRAQSYKPGWRRWFDRKTVSWADKIIFNTSEVVDYAQVRRRPEDQIVVIPNGVVIY